MIVVSPVSSMNVVEMFVAFVVIVVGDHFVSVAFETHALVAAAAGNAVAAVCADDWHLAVFVWTCAHSIFLHVFLEQRVTSQPRLLTRHTLMPSLLALTAIRCRTFITLETRQIKHINLLTPRSIAESHNIHMFVHVLSYSHINKFLP